LAEVIEKQEHETPMDIILRPLVVINLDDDNMEKVHNELNTLFTSSMSLIDDSSTKNVERGKNPCMTLDVIPLAIFPLSACYIDQDWEADDLLVG
jgi:hypothetical protein